MWETSSQGYCSSNFLIFHSMGSAACCAPSCLIETGLITLKRRQIGCRNSLASRRKRATDNGNLIRETACLFSLSISSRLPTAFSFFERENNQLACRVTKMTLTSNIYFGMTKAIAASNSSHMPCRTQCAIKGRSHPFPRAMYSHSWKGKEWPLRFGVLTARKGANQVLHDTWIAACVV
jgi:hypothetical protein